MNDSDPDALRLWYHSHASGMHAILLIPSKILEISRFTIIILYLNCLFEEEVGRFS